nr:MAG TPA_asm: hypothetical protein [Caudoviricetes sp.]
MCIVVDNHHFSSRNLILQWRKLILVAIHG